MNYWELRKAVSKLVPRQIRFIQELTKGTIKEKGRKGNYHQFNLKTRQWEKQERLLNTEEITSFLEVSLRAQACPMPLNLDTWDGLRCGYGCIYCYADSFRHSLYTSFFDNPKSIGLRHCNPDYYKTELDKLFKYRGKRVENADEKVKAISLDIPMRFGIRFEDFLPVEAKRGISLSMLKYLSENSYPVMINTKSDLVCRDDYIQAMADNKAGAAVHITMISSDDVLNKELEPGAPLFFKRINAGKQLSSAGVRVVARIEPFMTFINDAPDKLVEYISALKSADIKHVTFDTYSYSAKNQTIKQAFYNKGYDFERMFTIMSDCQWLGSLLLGKYMDLFRAEGIKCSTFDMGNVPTNDDSICCNVGDWFKGGWNLGCIVSMVRFIISAGRKVSWKDYYDYVMSGGGFLSQKLEKEVQSLWNLCGNPAYFPDWAPFLNSMGIDEYGQCWLYDNGSKDFRAEKLKDIL